MKIAAYVQFCGFLIHLQMDWICCFYLVWAGFQVVSQVVRVERKNSGAPQLPLDMAFNKISTSDLRHWRYFAIIWSHSPFHFVFHFIFTVTGYHFLLFLFFPIFEKGFRCGNEHVLFKYSIRRCFTVVKFSQISFFHSFFSN